MGSEEEKEEKKKQKCSDVIRFYLTTFFVLVACFSSFSFVFLVPFVIDPGFSTIFAEFDEVPKTCVTVDVVSMVGLSNCKNFSSCREGCTKDVYHCTLIFVNYFSDVDGIFANKNFSELDVLDQIDWDYTKAKLYPNVKGCGYPPNVNCTEFSSKYNNTGTIFPCYYSKIDPEVTLNDLDLEEVKRHLMYAIVLPWGSFIISILYLLITYVGMKKPEKSCDEIKETTSDKGSKEASNYSLRSISKTINQGVSRFRREPDDKGEQDKDWKGSSDILLAPSSLTMPNIGKRGDTLPPLERTPNYPRPSSTACPQEATHLLENDDGKKSWP